MDDIHPTEEFAFYSHQKKWIRRQAKNLFHTKQLRRLYDQVESFDISGKRKRHIRKQLYEAYQQNTRKDRLRFERDFKKPKQRRSRGLTKAARKILTPSEQKIKKCIFNLNRTDEKRVPYYGGTGSTMFELEALNRSYDIKLFVHPKSRRKFPFSIHFGNKDFYGQIEAATKVKERTVRKRFHDMKQKGFFVLLQDRHSPDRLSIWADGFFHPARMEDRAKGTHRYNVVKAGFTPGLHTLKGGTLLRPRRRKIRRTIAKT